MKTYKSLGSAWAALVFLFLLSIPAYAPPVVRPFFRPPPRYYPPSGLHQPTWSSTPRIDPSLYGLGGTTLPRDWNSVLSGSRYKDPFVDLSAVDYNRLLYPNYGARGDLDLYRSEAGKAQLNKLIKSLPQYKDYLESLQRVEHEPWMKSPFLNEAERTTGDLISPPDEDSILRSDRLWKSQRFYGSQKDIDRFLLRFPQFRATFKNNPELLRLLLKQNPDLFPLAEVYGWKSSDLNPLKDLELKGTLWPNSHFAARGEFSPSAKVSSPEVPRNSLRTKAGSVFTSRQQLGEVAKPAAVPLELGGLSGVGNEKNTSANFGSKSSGGAVTQAKDSTKVEAANYLLFSKDSAIPKGYAGNILVKSLGDLKAARSAIYHAGAHDALVGVQRSSDPGRNLKELEKKPSSLMILHDFPKDVDAAKRIHQFDVSSLQLNEVTKARRSLQSALSTMVGLRSFDVSVPESEHLSETTAERVKRILCENPEDGLAVLMGENNDGKIRFSDGSELPLSQLPHHGKIWVLGCRTVWHKLNGSELDLATGRGIHYAEAAAAAIVVAQDFDHGKSCRTMALDLQNLPRQEREVSQMDSASPNPSIESPAVREAPERPHEQPEPSGFAFILADNNIAVLQPLC